MLARAVIGLDGVMMGLFGSRHVDDAVLGRLERTRGLWRCLVAPDGTQKIPLTLFGSDREPDPAALQAAREVAEGFTAWRPSIATALFDHYTPYAEAASGAEPSGEGVTVPPISGPDQVWAHVSLQSLAITRSGGAVTTELVYAAAWDDDHMLGVRFQAGRFIELCGSV